MKHMPPIIELAGPPGAGKTSLAGLLTRRDPSIRVQTYPYFRRLRDDPFFAKSALVLTPFLLRVYRHHGEGMLTHRDIALMAILQGWPSELERLATSFGKTIILDEGAIDLVARLRGFGSQRVRGDAARSWWEGMTRRWARTLNLVILLEASPPTLLQRIRGRGVPHETDGLSDQSAMEYLAHISAEQEQIASALASMPEGPQLLRINTDDHRTSQADFLAAVDHAITSTRSYQPA